jgi:hypothetical protein
MKNIFIGPCFLLALIMMLPWLSSCSKDNETPPDLPSPKKTTPLTTKPTGICKLTKYSYVVSPTSSGSSTYEYEFSAQAHIIKITDGPNNYYTLEYNSSHHLAKSVFYGQSSKITKVYEYDTQGRWIKTRSESSSLTSNVATSTDTQTISYDTNGNRSKIETVLSTGLHTTRVYNYPAPNVIEEIYTSTYMGMTKRMVFTREYFADMKNKSKSYDDLLAPFYDHSTLPDGLIKKMVSETDSRDYSYEMNQQGYPTKATILITFRDKSTFEGSAAYEYSCN